MTEGQLPPETSLDDVKLKIKKNYTSGKSNVKTVTQADLKDGPQAYRIATLLELINPKTQEFHHYTLKIDQFNKTKTAWTYKPDRSVLLDGKKPDEIEKLYNFLHTAYKKKLGDISGEVHLISATDYAALENIYKAVNKIDDSDKLELVGKLLSKLDEDNSSISSFVKAFENSNDETIQHIATASRLLEYSKSLDKLKELVRNPNSKESDFQKHLKINPWMFGSEYSEILSKRTWTRDDNLDYMLRRTVDGYLEIVEIKTAFSDALFLHDSSHDSYYSSSKLSPVIGQVIRYIEEVERNRDSIIAKDKADTLKIRARVIVGRDGNKEHQAALRNFNAHLHQIEIITYDQLIRIADRVLSMFDVEVLPQQNDELDDEIPF